MENILQTLTTEFTKKYDAEPTRHYFSPGRVNLIGEHIDYNGGNVFPCAITQGTYGVARKRDDKTVRCYSINIPDVEVVSFQVDDINFSQKDSWVDYVKGMIHLTQQQGYKIDSGFDLVIYGNIPNGAGLSSSASLELLIGVLLEDLFDLDISRLELVQLGQKVENEVIGVNSGIMDQFAIGKGEKDMALSLNTNTLEYDLVPADFKDHVILIMNTNKRRELAGSKYNQRRQECEQALELLKQKADIDNLCDLSAEEFDKISDVLTNDTLLKRARHAVYENERVNETIDVLKQGDLERFGELLTASHTSLRDDYDITGVELDTLVNAALQQDGVLGARMTGAGMGGCAIALVDGAKVDAVQEAIQAIYTDRIGYEASFYVAEVGDGSKVLN